MKKLNLCLGVLLLLSAAAHADPIITITKLAGQPSGWDPTNNFDDIVITNANVDLTDGSAGTFRFHVERPGGIYDLHFYVANAEGGIDEVDITQDLFPNAPHELDPGADGDNVPSEEEWIEIDGAHIPFCTYFTFNGPSTRIQASIPEPGTLALIGLAGGGVLFFRRFRQY